MWCTSRVYIRPTFNFDLYWWSFISIFLSAILFADDNTLFHSSRNLTQLTNIINTELTNVVNWLNANKLSLNVDKNNFMVFRPKGNNQECPNIQINWSEIKKVSSAKFLCAFIDNKRSWAEHINHISKKVSKSKGIIIKARKSFDNDTLLNLRHYKALYYPIYPIVSKYGEQLHQYI